MPSRRARSVCCLVQGQSNTDRSAWGRQLGAENQRWRQIAVTDCIAATERLLETHFLNYPLGWLSHRYSAAETDRMFNLGLRA